MALESCPPLGRGSVDMHALHLAAVKNKLTEEVIAKATTQAEAPIADEAKVEPAAEAGAGD